MMREAQKMMKDPAFQERMKQITEREEFKKNMEKTKETLNDPEKLKEMEESMKKRVEEGNKELEEFKKKSAEAEAEEKKRAEEMKVSCSTCSYMYCFWASCNMLSSKTVSFLGYLSPRTSK